VSTQRATLLAGLLSALIVGVILRFAELSSRQLWLDELIQLVRFSDPSLLVRLKNVANDIAAAPLDYMVQRFTMSLLGSHSPFAARFHAAVFGVSPFHFFT